MFLQNPEFGAHGLGAWTLPPLTLGNVVTPGFDAALDKLEETKPEVMAIDK